MATKAYEKGLPLLVVAEERLRREALLDSANDVRPFWTTLDPAIGGSDGFQGYLRSWKGDVEERAREPLTKVEKLRDASFGQVLSAMPWYEMIGLTLAILGALAAAVSLGYELGGGKWPPWG